MHVMYDTCIKKKKEEWLGTRWTICLYTFMELKMVFLERGLKKCKNHFESRSFGYKFFILPVFFNAFKVFPIKFLEIFFCNNWAFKFECIVETKLCALKTPNNNRNYISYQFYFSRRIAYGRFKVILCNPPPLMIWIFKQQNKPEWNKRKKRERILYSYVYMSIMEIDIQ